MTLLIILALLIGGFALATVTGLAVRSLRIGIGASGRVGLALVFAFTGVGHFVETAAMVEMLPPWVPGREAIVYGTGVLELLAAIGLLVSRTARLTGGLLIAWTCWFAVQQ